MPAFVIVEIKIHDQDLYRSYTLLTPETIASYGGEFVVRGGETITLEGDWQPERLVVLKFPSVEIAQEWWNSEAYDEPKKIRQKAATTKMIIAAGI